MLIIINKYHMAKQKSYAMDGAIVSRRGREVSEEEEWWTRIAMQEEKCSSKIRNHGEKDRVLDFWAYKTSSQIGSVNSVPIWVFTRK